MKATLALVLFANLSLSAIAQTQVEPTPPPTPAPVTLNLDLSHMSLTAAQIRKRDRLLKPIYDNYQNVNLSSVSNALEQA